MKLSTPNPMREMLPAKAPAAMATNPSRLFHAMVKYSKCFPRLAIPGRSRINAGMFFKAIIPSNEKAPAPGPWVVS